MAWKPDAAIHVASSYECANFVVSLAGFSSLVCVPLARHLVVKGEWLAALIFLAVPLVGASVGRWIRLRIPSDFAILHGDRMELCGVGLFSWSQVQAIRWGSRRAADYHATIEIEVASGDGKPENCLQLDLAMVLPRDRVKLIRYLRVAGAEVRQDGWPEFCSRYAVPLVENCQHAQSTARAGDPTPTRSLWLELKYFLVGMLLWPLAFIALIPRCLVADWRPVCWLCAIAIGSLGLRQVIACGWIPAGVGKWAFMGLVLVVSVPFLLLRLQAGQSQTGRRTAPFTNALQRWAVYESTGRLPDGVLDEGAEVTTATAEEHQGPTVAS